MKRNDSIVFWSAGVATALALVVYSASRARAGDSSENPVALGTVHYRASVDAALAESKISKKPVFLQFQEVPGCATCQTFGRDVLSNVLLVDAIEEQFVPAVVYNNRKDDEGLLTRFSEPGWNNPVVRFLDGDGKDVIARADGIYGPSEIATRMIAALDATKREVPPYLRLTRDETDPSPRAKLTFAMACYWEGEGRLGGQDGVVATRVGSVNGHESVEVIFLPTRVQVSTLVKNALAMDCAGTIYCSDAAIRNLVAETSAVAKDRLVSGEFSFEESPASDQKHALRSSRFATLSLTPAQASKVNSTVFMKGDATRWLTERQKQELAKSTRSK